MGILVILGRLVGYSLVIVPSLDVQTGLIRWIKNKRDGIEVVWLHPCNILERGQVHNIRYVRRVVG